jgi:hypothetical protein
LSSGSSATEALLVLVIADADDGRSGGCRWSWIRSFILYSHPHRLHKVSIYYNKRPFPRPRRRSDEGTLKPGWGGWTGPIHLTVAPTARYAQGPVLSVIDALSQIRNSDDGQLRDLDRLDQVAHALMLHLYRPVSMVVHRKV